MENSSKTHPPTCPPNPLHSFRTKKAEFEREEAAMRKVHGFVESDFVAGLVVHDRLTFVSGGCAAKERAQQNE